MGGIGYLFVYSTTQNNWMRIIYLSESFANPSIGSAAEIHGSCSIMLGIQISLHPTSNPKGHVMFSKT